MSTVYEIRTIADLLTVPSDRREACLSDLRTWLDLMDIVHGDTPWLAVDRMFWTDDGDHSVSLEANGQQLLKLEVTTPSAEPDTP